MGGNVAVVSIGMSNAWSCDVEQCSADFYDSCAVCHKALCQTHAVLGRHHCNQSQDAALLESAFASDVMLNEDDLGPHHCNQNEDTAMDCGFASDLMMDKDHHEWESSLNVLYVSTTLTEVSILVAGKAINFSAFHYCSENSLQLKNNGLDAHGKRRRSYIDLGEQYLLYRYDDAMVKILL